MADGDPLDEYGLDGARVDPLDAYRRPRPLMLDSPPPPSRDPPRRSYGKGSVQEIGDPNPYGQHNLLTRGAVDLASALNPFSAAYDIGHNILGPGIENRNPGQLGLGAGAIGLAALPFGIAARNRVMFTPEMREVARRRYAEGATLADLADEIGVGISTLRRHFAEEGVNVRPRSGRADLPVAEIARLHDSGVSYRDMSERYGVNSHTISRHMRASGRHTRTPPRAEGLLDRVETMRRQGSSYGQIATELGLTRNAVAGMIRDLRASGRHVPAVLLALAGADLAAESLAE